MWVFYTALSLLVLLTAYFFVLPLSKKRPVLIRRGGLVAYGAVFVMALYQPLALFPFVILVAIVIFFLLLFRPWFVYGVTEAMITDALAKAASATRTPLEKTNGNYILDNSLRVRIRGIGGKVNIISFKKGGESKKAKLTMVVFKKFIQNYFV